MSSQLSVHASAAFNPHASLNLLSWARATSHGIDMTSSITQLSVTISSPAHHLSNLEFLTALGAKIDIDEDNTYYIMLPYDFAMKHYDFENSKKYTRVSID